MKQAYIAAKEGRTRKTAGWEKRVARLSLRFGLAFLLVSLGLSLRAASFDEAKLAEIPKALQRFVDDHTIAGAVTLVATSNAVVRTDAVGYSSLSGKAPMKADDLFWIASMTKPMTAVCILLLKDEGKLSIDDPVEKWLPAFKDQWMATEKSADRLVLKRPARPITLRDLLTHTSALGSIDSPQPDTTLAELAMAYAREPLEFEPGSRWAYCNAGINTLGRIVEVVSGKPYAAFIESRVIRPLGMNDTTFWPAPRQIPRIAKSYQPDGDGRLEETSVYFLKGDLQDRHRTAFPAGGLFSTAGDMAKFYGMMLQGGVWNGRRILSEESAGEMTHTQTGDIKTGFVDGISWGLGFQVVKEPQGITGMLSPGTFGHGGAYGTQSWADPKTGVVYVMMIQRAKLGNGDASPVRQAFQAAVAAAIVETPAEAKPTSSPRR
jgi:CubicO group peptidase (beta-lactamase class C family)